MIFESLGFRSSGSVIPRTSIGSGLPFAWGIFSIAENQYLGLIITYFDIVTSGCNQIMTTSWIVAAGSKQVNVGESPSFTGGVAGWTISPTRWNSPFCSVGRRTKPWRSGSFVSPQVRWTTPIGRKNNDWVVMSTLGSSRKQETLFPVPQDDVMMWVWPLGPFSTITCWRTPRITSVAERIWPVISSVAGTTVAEQNVATLSNFDSGAQNLTCASTASQYYDGAR